MSGYQDPGADPAHEWTPVMGLQKSCADVTFAAHTLVYDLPRPYITENEVQSKHWRVRHKASLETAAYTRAIAKAAKIPALGPSHVTITWYIPTAHHRDVCATSPFTKAAIDELVKCGVWPADDFRYIPRMTYEMVIDRKRPRIELQISEI